MPLPETMFCAQQIHIPPELPDILKQFTKAAIRTQPGDVLQWSAGYFSALSRGDPLPVKDRVEMPMATQKTDTGLTQGLLKVLHKQSLNTAMKHLCEILTADPEGGPARIPFETFAYVYRYLSKLDTDSSAAETESYLANLKGNVESSKNGMIGLSDFFVLKGKFQKTYEKKTEKTEASNTERNTFEC
ncbi:ropporin-1-like protein isoform X2 [Manis pentadactyla]|uniref:ropporin-1-like protein isoform X2 n=1 Tax=Manis pentadactyla TaxID=143292 RepID=UPI00255C3700|nr:ropporin-1-like protein isoform X2 [Manis pentadactyla]